MSPFLESSFDENLKKKLIFIQGDGEAEEEPENTEDVNENQNGGEEGVGNNGGYVTPPDRPKQPPRKGSGFL